mgnify:CR=1 FL=1
MQIAVDSVLLLLVSGVGLDQVSIAWVSGNKGVALISIIIFGFLDENSLKFLFVNPLALQSDFNQHLNALLDVDTFNHLTISFFFDLAKHQWNQSFLNVLILHNMSFKLCCLHCFNIQEVLHFRHKVFVHVQEDVLNHDDDILLQVPHFGDLLDEFIITVLQLLADGAEHFNCGLAHIIVQHLSMLV